MIDVPYEIKPETKYYDFIEMCHIVNKELGYDQRSCGKIFYPDTMTFDDWQRVIQQKWNDLFSHVADDFGYVDIWVCW